MTPRPASGAAGAVAESDAVPTKLLHDIFADVVCRDSDRVAIDVPPASRRRERRSVSYAELDRLSNGIAHAIHAAVDAPDRIVVVLLPRESEHVYAAQLGTLKAGAAFACIAPAFPDGQVRTILDDAEPAAVLTDARGRERLLRLGARASVVDVHGVAQRHAAPLRREWLSPTSLAYLIYTSGTTGRPKGVMLSHRNILTDAYAGLQVLTVQQTDSFLSFLPLSHTFERTCGYYLTIMCGATVSYARSVQALGDDLQTIKPTMLISVPRIYERIWAAIRAKLDEGSPLKKKLFHMVVDVGYARFEHAQGRGSWKLSFLLWPVLNALVASKVLARLGGRMRGAMSGGAALPPEVSRVFIGLGLPVLQGYGLTETSPIVCANSIEDNLPASVGKVVPGVEVKIGENNALLIKGPNVMMGYWNNQAATRAMIQPCSLGTNTAIVAAQAVTIAWTGDCLFCPGL